jgi:TolB-like protein/Tfp pilus assembly protein PilF
MSSIIEGYSYDIFISYRQNDNRSGWVTEFVAALQEELAATLKESVSVYFDTNPHDGLLETHNVDKSLEGKLKCLIFIPIISQTYCDSKSYAWQHEFVDFNKLSKDDQFGRDIRLASGNVTSRILPIKIHDLDPEDKTLLENELGGTLRSIEFIYKSAGVNRPLRANEDHPQDNLNKTYYRDQINKVANAVKEIITAIKKNHQQSVEVPKDVFKAKPEKPKNLRTKIIIASGIILTLLVLGYFLIPRLSKPKEQLEKSIAVLPFRNDSPNDSTTYFLNGVMEEILNNLQKISDFSRVLSRNSVEQFRSNTTKSTPEIAKKLNVNYIVEGSGQKYGNKFVLRVQLIVGNNEKHLWGKSYEQEILETTDIINIQSQIAQTIAAELHAIITPEEKQLINKIPTTNLTAYDFYQQGREEHTKYWIDNRNIAALQKAEALYSKSLQYDSTFAQAYSGLALVYWDKHWNIKEYNSENFMDSVLILANTALSFNDQLSEAYTLRGRYYSVNGNRGNPEQALEEYDKAIKLNPNDWMAYRGKGLFYLTNVTDLVNSINYLQKAASINRGAELPSILGNIGAVYFNAGFPEKAKQYFQDKFKLDGDSLSYYNELAGIEFGQENFNKSIEYGEKGYSIDSTNVNTVLSLGKDYELLGQYKESLKYLKKWVKIVKATGVLTEYPSHLGYIYWQNGYKEEAENFYNELIKNSIKWIELKREFASFNYYYLAEAYAFKGEKNRAYENLRLFKQDQRTTLWVSVEMKTNPLFNSIRKEPEFQQIATDIEAKYQAEHERVRKWLEEQGML